MLSQLRSILLLTDPAHRRAAGAALYRELTINYAHHMEHMAYEETKIMEMFRAKYSEEQILVIDSAMKKGLAPNFVQKVYPYFIKYQNSQGRAILLQIVKTTAPAIFEEVCAYARKNLSIHEISALERAAGYALPA